MMVATVCIVALFGADQEQLAKMVEASRQAAIVRAEARLAELKQLLPKIKRARLAKGTAKGWWNTIQLPTLEQAERLRYSHVDVKRRHMKDCAQGIEDLTQHLVDLRDNAKPYRPELYHRLRVGQVGVFCDTLRIVQVIDKANMICNPLFSTQPNGHRNTIVWLSGVSTAGLADERLVRLSDLFVITGTRQYTTVLGGSRTVMRLERVDEPAP